MLALTPMHDLGRVTVDNFFLRGRVLLQKQVTVPLSSVEFRRVFASFT